MRRSRIIAITGAVALATSALGATAATAAVQSGATATTAATAAGSGGTYVVLAEGGADVKALAAALSATGATKSCSRASVCGSRKAYESKDDNSPEFPKPRGRHR